VVGDHTVIFAALGERLELTHKTVGPRDLSPRCPARRPMVVAQPPGVLRHAGCFGPAGRSLMITSIQGKLAMVSPLLAVVELNGPATSVHPDDHGGETAAPGDTVRLQTHVVYRGGFPDALWFYDDRPGAASRL